MKLSFSVPAESAGDDAIPKTAHENRVKIIKMLNLIVARLKKAILYRFLQKFRIEMDISLKVGILILAKRF